MRNMLGAHVIPRHWGAFGGRHDADWLKAWGPRYVKVVCDDETIPYVTQLPATAKIIVRNYPLSEQGHDRGFRARGLAAEAASRGLAQSGTPRDALVRGPGAFAGGLGAALRGVNDLPETVGMAHAQAHARTAAWAKAQGIDPARLIFEGLNEPMLWSSEPPELVARYEAARLKEAHRLGLRCVIGNFGVGWPGNGGVQDAPVQWDFFQPAIAQMVAGDYLGLHEYWALNGPTENWQWWGGRFRQCPYRVPILITETGVDTGVTGNFYGGWGDIPATSWEARAKTYVDWLLWYAAQALADGRIQCVFPFTYDIGSRDWEKFDVRNQVWLTEFLTRPADAVIPAPVIPNAPTAPTTPTTPTGDAVWPALTAAFGAQVVDVRAKLETNGSYPARALSAVKRVVVHHSAAKASVSWAAIARYHVRTRGWPGIGYHFGITPDGGLSYLGSVTTHRYHAGDANADSIGVCFAGDFRTDTPTAAALATLDKLLTVLTQLLGRAPVVVGHRDVMQTECPGDNLYAAAVAPDALTAALRGAAAANDLVTANPDAALLKAILAAGALPVSGEYRVAVGGQTYVCQTARRPGQAAQVFYCPDGQWGDVRVLS